MRMLVRPAPLRAAAVALAATMLLALTIPLAPSGQRWLLPVGTDVPAHAQVLRALPLAGALVVQAGTPPVGAVPYDHTLDVRSLAPAPDAQGLRLDSGVASTRADAAWSTTTGERAVVALIDTGVAPVPALEGAVAGEIDFSGTGGGDGYGHGTFMASLIVGRGTTARGVAPGAGVLSLKVAGDDGSATLGAVLSALQWLHGPGRASGIRVAALALGVDPDTDAGRMLDAAVARLAAAGVLVVVAAGNDGPGRLSSPATAVGAFVAGAVDDQATADRSDDVVADFSATGTDGAGVAQPDVLASGVAVVGTIAPDSLIATTYPEATIEGEWFRGSGTSMATAITAGVAALASSARPDLDGSALDAALRAGSDGLDAPTAVAAAVASPAGATDRGQAQPPANGGQGRGNGHAEPAAPGGIQWRGIQWRGIQWRGDHWGDADWEFARWGGIQWRSNGWAGESASGQFEGIQWRGIQWRGDAWTLITGR